MAEAGTSAIQGGMVSAKALCSVHAIFDSAVSSNPARLFSHVDNESDDQVGTSAIFVL